MFPNARYFWMHSLFSRIRRKVLHKKSTRELLGLDSGGWLAEKRLAITQL
jgi:hypothetical protein